MSELFAVSARVFESYPHAVFGALALENTANPAESLQLELRGRQLQDRLIRRYAGLDRQALRDLPQITAYQNFYRRFRKTYHLALQLESVVLGGRTIQSTGALVQAMFMAELDHLLLTSGHDLQQIEPPVRLRVARGDETYVRMNGQKQQLKPEDLYAADRAGVIASIVYGPDRRSRIRTETARALFVVYGPAGIQADQVQAHLDELEELARTIAPATTASARWIVAGPEK